MIRISRCTAAWLALSAIAAYPVHASIPVQQSPAPASAATSMVINPDRSIEELVRLQCPPGIERFLPGTYYYCVGTRDVAMGKNDQARSMLELAARWGSKPAQFLLGIGYYKGDLQPRDRVRGLAWLGLATERKDPTYVAIFASAWKQATPQEQASAQDLWRTMLPTYGDQYAARRAERRFKRERDALLAQRQTNGQQVCVAGLTSGNIAPLPMNKGFSDNDSPCNGTEMAAVFVAQRLEAYADQLFDGWKGHVTVGDLQAVPAPPK